MDSQTPRKVSRPRTGNRPTFCRWQAARRPSLAQMANAGIPRPTSTESTHTPSPLGLAIPSIPASQLRSFSARRLRLRGGPPKQHKKSCLRNPRRPVFVHNGPLAGSLGRNLISAQGNGPGLQRGWERGAESRPAETGGIQEAWVCPVPSIRCGR